MIELPSALAVEAARAKWWRVNVARLSIEELARRTGYSWRAIYRFESGVTNAGKPHKPLAWHRYKLCCAALHYAKGREFQWGIK